MSPATELGSAERRRAIGENEGHPARAWFRNEQFRADRLQTEIGRYRDCMDVDNEGALQVARQAPMPDCSKWPAWAAARASLNTTYCCPRDALSFTVMVGDGHQIGVSDKAEQHDRSGERPGVACAWRLVEHSQRRCPLWSQSGKLIKQEGGRAVNGRDSRGDEKDRPRLSRPYATRCEDRTSLWRQTRESSIAVKKPRLRRQNFMPSLRRSGDLIPANFVYRAL
jgi:hypothetical protein